MPCLYEYLCCRRESGAPTECRICGCRCPNIGELHPTFPFRVQGATTTIYPRLESCQDLNRFLVERQYWIWYVLHRRRFRQILMITSDLVKARLTSLRAVMTILKLSMSVYPPGAWLTHPELSVNEDSSNSKATRLESWNLRSGLSSWTWRVISELRDADEEARTSPLRRNRLSAHCRRSNAQQQQIANCSVLMRCRTWCSR